MKISLAIVFFASLLSNCQEEVQSSDITKIEFGTSFGMCVGYCTQTLIMTAGSAEKTVTPRAHENLKEKSCSASYEGFDALSAKVNLLSFMGLEETIGCPDCADGGAEWIEITTPEGSKKVTYEFRKEPHAVKSFIGELRKYCDQLGECE